MEAIQMTRFVSLCVATACLFVASALIVLAGEQAAPNPFEIKPAFTITPGRFEAPPKPIAPTAGRHKTLTCESHGCACGCRAGGVCRCHPGWERSTGSWWFYRDRFGTEKAAYNQETGEYWKVGLYGTWEEWREEARLVIPTYRVRKC